MARRCLSLTLAASLLFACQPPPARVATPEPAAPPPALAFTVADPPSAQATRTSFERPTIEPLAVVGCRFEVARWDATQTGLNLYLETGSAAWARLPRGAKMPVTVEIKDGWGEGVLELEQRGAKVRTLIHADDLALRPVAPVVLGGFAVPLPSRKLTLEQIEDGAARVRFFMGADFSSGSWQWAKWRCDQMGLAVQSFESPIAKAKKLGDAVLEAGHLAALRTEPVGEVVAELEPHDDLSVDVIERRQNHTRIRWTTEHMTFFGWVDSALLSSPADGRGIGGLGLSGRGEGKKPPKRPRPVRCDRELPLIVWQRGLARTVGTLGTEARFTPSIMLGELQAIHIDDLDIQLADGSFYTVASDVPKHCVSVAPEP